MIVVVLIAINLAVYAPLRGYEFVSLDDDLYVADNPNIAGGLRWQSVWWALTTDRAGYWVPLMWLSHIIDVELYGVNAGPHHVTNVLFHVLNTLLLLGLLLRMTGHLWRSALAAALFAVHPLHVESVAWIAERKDVLSTFFWMLTCCAYVCYVRRSGASRYALVILLFAMSLTVKPMVVTLPFVLLLLDAWPLRRARLEREQAHAWVGLAIEKLPLFALAGVSSVLTILFHQNEGGIGSLQAFPPTARAANIVITYAIYIRDMLWPVNLAAFYPYDPRSLWPVAASLAVLVTISAIVVMRRRQYPYLIVGWLWYLGTLVPVIGLVQAGTQSRADRFTYIPLIGLFIMTAWGMAELARWWPHRTRVLTIGAVVVIVAATALARNQVRHWENRFTLWGHALEVAPNNYVAHNVLGMALVDSQRVDEAIAHYQEALRIQPDYWQARNNLGIALSLQGRLHEGISEFQTVIGGGGWQANAYYNLGLALAQLGKLDEALAQYSAALEIDSTFVVARTGLGDVLVRKGRVDGAIEQYKESLRINPRSAEAHNNLAVALSRQGRVNDAIPHYTEAIRIKPALAEAHNGLGAALGSLGRYAEAMRHFAEALRLEPELADARANLEAAVALQQRR